MYIHQASGIFQLFLFRLGKNKSRFVRAAFKLILSDYRRFRGLNNHFNNRETEKLTAAPNAARITVFNTSAEPMLAITVKAVPETVPAIVPPAM